MNRVRLLLVLGLLMLSFQPALAVATFLDSYLTDFAAYDYNTAAYWTAGSGYVGCGPTTGAMILNYFQNHYGAAGLMEALGGLATANTLHSGAYMQTANNGFGSVYRIEPGLEGYATAKGHSVDAVYHVSPTYTPPNPTWDAYGPYGASWNNDAAFWQYDGANWFIDDSAFNTYVSAKLLAGIPIFLTVDGTDDGINGGDHWVPLVGVDDGTYWYYNTWDTTLHSASVSSVWEASAGVFSISGLRTVSYEGAITGGDVPEPTTLVLFGCLGALVYLKRKARK